MFLMYTDVALIRAILKSFKWDIFFCSLCNAFKSFLSTVSCEKWIKIIFFASVESCRISTSSFSSARALSIFSTSIIRAGV